MLPNNFKLNQFSKELEIINYNTFQCTFLATFLRSHYTNLPKNSNNNARLSDLSEIEMPGGMESLKS